MSQKPECKKFIVAAIRENRHAPWNMKSGVSAGVSLKRLWGFAYDVYSEAEFREALQTLLDNEILIATWGTQHINEHRERGPERLAISSKIPAEMPLAVPKFWRRDMEGSPIEYSSNPPVECEEITNVKLYIVDDGLPKSVRRVYDKMARTVASAIALKQGKESE